MPKKLKAGLTRGLFISRHVERFRELLAKFQPFLSRRKPTTLLEDFDEAAEELIGQVFGEASEELEAYHYAKMGEGSFIPEEAQESGAHDTERECLHQRRQVLESCLSELEVKKNVIAIRLSAMDGRSLQRMKVADYMSPDVRSVHRAASIKEAGRLLQKWKVGSLLVDDGSRYLGIITDTDLSRKAVARGLDPNTTTVTGCMSKSVLTIEDSEPLTEAIRIMKLYGIRHLPVTEDGTIIGVLSVSDLLRAYEQLTKSEAGTTTKN
ncbi:MAG: CBS domain-containing protein [Nitrospiraceae bacterium]